LLKLLFEDVCTLYDDEWIFLSSAPNDFVLELTLNNEGHRVGSPGRGR
jgi:hypothetical protein